MGEDPMEFSCSSGSPSTMNWRRRSSVTHWNDAVSFSNCNCSHPDTPTSACRSTHKPSSSLERLRAGAICTMSICKNGMHAQSAPHV